MHKSFVVYVLSVPMSQVTEMQTDSKESSLSVWSTGSRRSGGYTGTRLMGRPSVVNRMLIAYKCWENELPVPQKSLVTVWLRMTCSASDLD